jgi:hypothetical protein
MTMPTDQGRAVTGPSRHEGAWGRNRWRLVGWGAAAGILLLPLIAMQFDSGVNWTAFDFAFAAGLMLAVGIPLELAFRRSSDKDYRTAVGVALAAGFLLMWINGAVGILGSENNDANVMYDGVLAIAFIGAIIARFQPRGMAVAMSIAAIAQASTAVIALVLGLGAPESSPRQVVSLNAFFVALFVTSAVLFQQAGRRAAEQVTP